MKNVRTKMIAVLAGVAVTGIASAAAASLPTDTDSLGAANDVVAACQAIADGAVEISFTTSYVNTTIGYGVDSVDLDNLSGACDGLDIAVTLVDDAGVVLDEATNTVDAAGTSVAPTVTVAAADVYGVAVVISGPTTP